MQATVPGRSSTAAKARREPEGVDIRATVASTGVSPSPVLDRAGWGQRGGDSAENDARTVERVLLQLSKPLQR